MTVSGVDRLGCFMCGAPGVLFTEIDVAAIITPSRVQTATAYQADQTRLASVLPLTAHDLAAITIAFARIPPMREGLAFCSVACLIACAEDCATTLDPVDPRA